MSKQQVDKQRISEKNAGLCLLVVFLLITLIICNSNFFAPTPIIKIIILKQKVDQLDSN